MKKYLRVNKNTNIVEGTTESNNTQVDTDEITYVEVQSLDNMHNEFIYSYNDGQLQEVGINLIKNSMRQKQDKIINISNILVTTSSGKVFDGDETSQERMLRAIKIADITNQTTTDWKLADNTIVLITLDELKEALALSGQEMSKLWLS